VGVGNGERIGRLERAEDAERGWRRTQRGVGGEREERAGRREAKLSRIRGRRPPKGFGWLGRRGKR